MRRHRKTRSNARRTRLSVSLFPFLAVLICTLGVLIMMLVMAVKSADDQVRKIQTDSDEAQQAEIAELESQRDLGLARIEGLEMVRPKALSRLEDSQANRSHVQQQIRKIKRELARVRKQWEDLDRETKKIAQFKDPEAPEFPELPTDFQINQVGNQRVLEELNQQIAQATQALDVKRTTAQQAGPAKFVIVPHKGGGGTFRRPIFMECTVDAITLRPSGIRLAKSEFVPPLQAGNMLDSALLTIREYWRRYDIAGDEGTAYPLIVVRPGGAETFVLARHAMKSWDDEFGYELVETETDLDFGVKDPQLDEEVLEAINQARVQQQQRIARSRYQQSVQGQFGSPSSGHGSGRYARPTRSSKRSLRPGLVAADSGGFVSNAGQFADRGHGSGYPEDHTDSYVSAASGVSQGSGANFSQANQHGEVEYDSNESAAEDASRLWQNQVLTGQTAEADVSSDSNNSRDVNHFSEAQGGQDGGAQGGSVHGRQSIASQRGADWALPTQTPGATGYVRPIRVVCSRDVLEVVTNGTPKRIMMTGDTADSIDPLIDEVWAQIDQWGIPGANAFWKPQLKFRILDGGQQRFLEIQSLLNGSGLTVSSADPSQELQ